jgi:hypothetical protein
LIVVPHWWWYPSDSEVGHLWVAAIQVLAFLGVLQLSRVFGGEALRTPRRDRNVGLITAGVAGFSVTMFILLFGEDGGTLDMLAPAFTANPPEWWWTVAHSWLEWFLLTAGLLPVSVFIRRGWALGYLGLAVVVSLGALLHWAHYYDAYPFGGSRGGVFTWGIMSGLCWLLAGHRLIVRNQIA